MFTVGGAKFTVGGAEFIVGGAYLLGETPIQGRGTPKWNWGRLFGGAFILSKCE